MKRILFLLGFGFMVLLFVMGFLHLRLRLEGPSHLDPEIQAFHESVRQEGYQLLNQASPPHAVISEKVYSEPYPKGQTGQTATVISETVTNLQYPWVQPVGISDRWHRNMGSEEWVFDSSEERKKELERIRQLIQPQTQEVKELIEQTDEGSLSRSSSYPIQLDLHVNVDGTSTMVFYRNQVRWYHSRWAAPGRERDRILPTIINNEIWLPEWPNEGRNDGCNCWSSIYPTRGVALPAGPMRIDVLHANATGFVNLVQCPNQENQYVLAITFDNSYRGGSFWCELTLQITPLEQEAQCEPFELTNPSP